MTHGVTAGLPSSGTHLPVLVCVLEGLHQSQGFIHGAPHGQVIHGDLAQHSFGINDKQTPAHTALKQAWSHPQHYHLFYAKDEEQLKCLCGNLAIGNNINKRELGDWLQ